MLHAPLAHTHTHRARPDWLTQLDGVSSFILVRDGRTSQEKEKLAGTAEPERTALAIDRSNFSDWPSGAGLQGCEIRCLGREDGFSSDSSAASFIQVSDSWNSWSREIFFTKSEVRECSW